MAVKNRSGNAGTTTLFPVPMISQRGRIAGGRSRRSWLAPVLLASTSMFVSHVGQPAMAACAVSAGTVTSPDEGATVTCTGVSSGDHQIGYNLGNSIAELTVNVTDTDVTFGNSTTIVLGRDSVLNTSGAGVIRNNSPSFAAVLGTGGAVVVNNGAGFTIENLSGVSYAVLGIGAPLTVNNALGASIIGHILSVGIENDLISNAGIIRRGDNQTNANVISLMDGDDTLELWTTSSITGVVDAGSGEDTIRFRSAGPDASFDISSIGAAQQYRSFEIFEKADSHRLTLEGVGVATGPWRVNQGELFLGAEAQWLGAAAVNGGRLSGVGSVGGITVNAGGVLAPGASIGTLSTTGNVTFEAGSVFEADIDPAASDRLAVDGDVAINGGTLRILPATGVYAPTSYDLITAAGAIQGSFTSSEIINGARLGTLVMSASRAEGDSVYRLTLATGPDDGAGCDLDSGQQLCSFVNQNLTGDFDGQGGGDVLTFQGDSTYSGAITGVDGLNIGTSGGDLSNLNILSGRQTVDRTTVFGNATLLANGILDSQSVGVNPGGTLGGGGTIIGAVDNRGALSPGNSPGILTFSGSITNQGDAAELLVEIDGPTAGTGDGFHDQIRVVGAPGTFHAAGTLRPVTRGFAEAVASPYTPGLGERFTIVTATGGVTGAFTGIAQPTPGSLAAGTRMDVLYGPDSIALAVTPDRYDALAGLTDNQRSVAGAIDTVRPAAGARGGDLDAVFGALYALDAASAPHALDQMGGVLHADALTAARDAARMFGDTVMLRAADRRRDGLAVGRGPTASARLTAGGGSAGPSSGPLVADDAVWTRVFGSVSAVDNDGNAAGYDARTGGVAIGIDRALTADVSLGMAVGYLNSRVEADRNGGRADIDTYAAALYGAYAADGWFADGSAMYAYGDHDTSRQIRFGAISPINRTATASAASHDVGLAVGAGYAWSLDGVRVEPAAGLRYDRVVRNSFVEEGAGALNLAVDHETLETLRTSLGVSIVWAHDMGGIAIEPVLRARWDHDIMDQAATSRARLAGARFDAAGSGTGSGAGRDAAVLGAGMTAVLSDRFNAFADYEADLRRNASEHTFSAGLRFLW